MKIVINNCYGGFGLSLEAEREYLKLIGKEAHFYRQVKYEYCDGENLYEKIESDGTCSFSTTSTKDLGETTENPYNEGDYFYDGDLERTDENLIAVVEKLGNKASGSCADLKIVEVPDGVEWEIKEYDGIEWVAEKHRTWG